jgi:MtrB/PioB family decaheme-associated outer membrane protein
MTTRTGLLVTTAVGALIVGMGYGSQAQAADMVTKAAPVAVEQTGWWMGGFVEVGGRFFIQKDGGGTGGNVLTGPSDPANRLSAGPFASLGKFYEYRDLREGPFGDIFLAGGSLNGLYQYNFLAKNIGYRDQSYWFDWSQAGVQYLTLGFDQLPHTYNDNATTIFQGAGSDTLAVPDSVRSSLATLLGPTSAVTGSNTVSSANLGAIARTIEGNLNGFRLGFDRYTGTADYRWTPDDNNDVKVDYDIIRRDGTQPMGALTFNGVERGGRIVLELPRPIHDETHNANANWEYAGVTPWGKKFNVNLGYGISAYRDDADSFTFQNPFVFTNGAFAPVNNLMSLPPDNTAHIFRLNGGLDVFEKSRWVVAVNYTHGQQDSAFLPFSINPAAIAGAATALGAAPALVGSSGFHSDNLLVNNVLTTKWTTELSQTTRYRYYNYDAPKDLALNGFPLADSANVIDFTDDSLLRRGISYTKQNASTDFVWHPATWHWLTLGAGVGWEQWNRRLRGEDPGDPDVRVTNEFMGKLFGTAKPWDWSQFRASYIHAERRFEGDYQQNIGGNDESCNTPTTVCTGFRAYDLADRNRDKLNVYFDWFAFNGLTITPTGGFRFDDYSMGMFLDQSGGGLIHDNSWNAGIEVSWTINPGITLIGSYTREEGRKEIWIPFTSHTALPGGINNLPFESDMDDKIDTFMAGANFVLIPGTWDLKVAYTLMHATGTMSQSPFRNANPAIGNLALFPDQSTTLNRVDVQTKYKVDPSFMQQFGFKGETYIKLRYLWEHNEVTDWAADNWNYQYLINGDTGVNKNLFLGWNNPNYNVQLLMASLGFKW